MTDGVGPFTIGVDQPTKYGYDWEGAYLAGSTYSQYDDNDYFEVNQLLLVHPSVPQNKEAIHQRIECAFVEQLGLEAGDGGLEDGEYEIEWSDDLENLPEKISLKHGFVLAYIPYWGGVRVDMEWDSSYLGSVEIDQEAEDDEDDD